jgi:ABC-2 type transport system ATP-binding protein
VLRLKNFYKAYPGGSKILDIPSLEIPQGIHWIKGRNGSGKTTFFRSIAGIIPSEGEIHLSQQYEIRRNPVEYRLRVNYSEAEPLFPAFLTGREILEFIASAKQASNSEREQLLESLGLSLFFENPCGTYSSGMLKKLSLAMAFLGKPELIMLDEPLITIDQISVQILTKLISDFRKEKGVSFLISSHQDFDPRELSPDAVFQVEGGKILPLQA